MSQAAHPREDGRARSTQHSQHSTARGPRGLAAVLAYLSGIRVRVSLRISSSASASEMVGTLLKCFDDGALLLGQVTSPALPLSSLSEWLPCCHFSSNEVISCTVGVAKLSHSVRCTSSRVTYP